MATATKYTVTQPSGDVLAAARTEKQTVAIAKCWPAHEITIVGSDGVTYERRGKGLVPAGYVAPEATEREIAAAVSDMTRRPIDLDSYDDAEAIEDLGLGTRYGGLFRGR